MVTQIKAYKTSDGTIHTDENAAAKAELAYLINQMNGQTSFAAQISWLDTNLFALQEAYKLYCRHNTVMETEHD